MITPERGSVRSRLHAGAAHSIIGSVFAQGSTFLLNLVVANVLGQFAFGVFTVVQGTLNTVSTLAQFSTGYTATKYLAEFRERAPQRAARILHLCGVIATVTGCLAAAALFTGAGWIAEHALNAPAVSSPLRIAAVAVPFLVMNGYRLGALAGLERFASIARAGISSGVIYLTLGIAGAAFADVNGALAGIATAAAAQWLILGRLLRQARERNRLLSAADPWQEHSVLLNFALPATLGGAITLPALWLAGAFLVQQEDGLNQMALFGAANNFRVIVLFLPNVLTSVGMSLLNNQLSANPAAYRRLFWWNLGLSGACAALGAATVSIFAPSLLRIFGSSFEDAATVLRVLMAAAFTEALAVWTYQIIQSQGRMWLTMSCVVLPRDGLILLLALLLAPGYGATGLAAAHALGWMIAFVIIGAVTYRLGLTPRERQSSPLDSGSRPGLQSSWSQASRDSSDVRADMRGKGMR